MVATNLVIKAMGSLQGKRNRDCSQISFQNFVFFGHPTDGCATRSNDVSSSRGG